MQTRQLCWAIALALNIISSDSRSADCPLMQYASLPLTYDHEGLPMIPVAVNGRSVSFLVDTGGIQSSVMEDIATELKLPEDHIGPELSLRFVNGKRITKVAVANTLQVGRMRALDAALLEFPRDADVYSSRSEWSGSLAPDVLRSYDIDFDFGANKFSIFSSKHCRGAVVYWTANAVAVVPIRTSDYKQLRIDVLLDGVPIVAEIDTGSSVSFMNVATAAKLLGLQPTDPRFAREPSGESYRFPFKSLSFEGVSVENPNILLRGDARYLGPDSPAQLVLGMTILRHLHLYIAYAEEKLYISPAGSVGAPP